MRGAREDASSGARLERVAPLAALAVGAAIITARALALGRALSLGRVPGDGAVEVLEAGASLVSEGTLVFEARVGPLAQGVGALAYLTGASTMVAALLVHAVTAFAIGAGSLAVVAPLRRGASGGWAAAAVFLLGVAAGPIGVAGVALLCAASALLARPAGRVAAPSTTALGVAALWAPSFALIGLLVVAFAVTVTWRDRPRRRAIARGAAPVGAALAAGAAVVIATRSAGDLVALAAPSPSAAPMAWCGFAVLVAGVAFAAGRERRLARRARVVASTTALTLLAALLGGPDPYALAWPSAAALALVVLPLGTRARSRVPARAAGAAVLGTFVFAALLGPGLRAAEILWPGSPPLAPASAPEHRAAAWVGDTRGCVVWLGDLDALRLGGSWRGLVARGGDAREREELARAVAASRCERAIVRADPLARGPRGERDRFFGPELLAFAEHYRPLARLGPATLGAIRRPTPAPIGRRALRIASWPSARLAAGEALDVPLEEPVADDALLELEVEVDPGPWPAPSIRVVATRAGEPVASPLELRLAPGRQRLVVAVDPPRAAHRWTFGRDEAPRAPRADGLRLERAGAPLPLGRPSVSVHGAALLTPPADRGVDRGDGRCTSELDLARDGAVHLSAGRTVRSSDDGFLLAPRRGAVASVDAALTPCAGTCLFAEVGVVRGASAEVRVELRASGRARAVAQRSLGTEFRQPIELPIDRHPGAPILVGVTASSEDGALVHLRRPRVAPCVALFSVVSAAHDGDLSVVPADAAFELEGDELRLALRPSEEVPPRLEVPVAVPRDPASCLAVDLDARARTEPIAMLLGVRRGARIYPLARVAAEPGAPLRSVSELSLARFAGDEVRLVFSAWPAEGGGGLAAFVRPRVYACGTEPGWAF